MTAQQFYIVAERVCEDCAGAGVVEHPAWRRYFAMGLDKWRSEGANENAWWRDQGYDAPPPQEATCADCDGTGRITWRLTVEELAAALRPWLEVHP